MQASLAPQPCVKPGVARATAQGEPLILARTALTAPPSAWHHDDVMNATPLCRLAITIAMVVAIAFPLGAQVLAAKTAPDPAPNGALITLTIKAGAGAINLPNSAGYWAVHMDTPTGPIVPGNMSLPVIITVPACGSFMTNWQAPMLITSAPATFFFEVRAWDANYTVQTTDFFPVTVNPPQAVLNELYPAARGQSWQLALGAPNFPAAPYIAAISMTTNTGILGPGGAFIALDADPFFALSFPQPMPGLFMGLQGVLDFSGVSPPIVTLIPNLPFLACLPLHIQAAVLDPVTGGLHLSQCHDTWIN